AALRGRKPRRRETPDESAGTLDSAGVPRTQLHALERIRSAGGVRRKPAGRERDSRASGLHLDEVVTRARAKPIVRGHVQAVRLVVFRSRGAFPALATETDPSCPSHPSCLSSPSRPSGPFQSRLVAPV